MKKLKIISILTLLAGMILIISCQGQQNPVIFRGSVTDFLHPDAPIVLGLWPASATPATGKFPLLYKQLDGAGEFNWAIWENLDGKFAMAAFEDFNNNLLPDKDERLSYADITPLEISSSNHKFENLVISISTRAPRWSDVSINLLDKFFKELNEKDPQIVNLFHPIRYYDIFYYDYDDIIKNIKNYFFPPTSETYLSHSYKLIGTNASGNVGEATIEWITQLPKTYIPDKANTNTTIVMYMEENRPYITAIIPNWENRGIKFNAGATGVDSNTLLAVDWVDESNILPNPTFDIELSVYSTPSSCVTDLYSKPITPHTWSKPFTFYNNDGTLLYKTEGISPPFYFYDKTAGNKPLKFKTADGSLQNFHFNPYCLYRVKVWIHSDDAKSDAMYRDKGPFGILYLTGTKR